MMISEQKRMTRSQTSKENGKSESCNKSLETDCEGNRDDTSEDTVQERVPGDDTSREKAKIDDKDKHVATDHTSNTNAENNYLPDEARADNTDDENTAAEDVDYDEIFDDNLLKQAFEYNKRRVSSEVDKDVSEDEDVDEDSRVSSSQEKANRAITRNDKQPVNEQEQLSDFDGEIVFRKDLQSPSAKKAHSDDEEDNKKPMAKRSKRDLEFSSDDENPSEKERKEDEAVLKYYYALQSNLQKLDEFTVPQIIHALLVTSGYVDEAEDYFQNGTGNEQWTSKEDKILLSKNKDDISRLVKKRGLNTVIDRMNFMEGIS